MRRREGKVLSELIKCIFCLGNKKSSVEHVFPDSLGGQLKINNVCKECNDFLGEHVDIHLVNHSLMQFVRSKFNLPGKKGYVPNPFAKSFLKDDPTRKVKFGIDGKAPYLVTSVKQSTDGKSITISVDASDRNNLPTIVNKALKRKGLSEMTLQEVEAKLSYETLEKPELIVNIEADINTYRKAILKIIFEFTNMKLGDKYLDDPMAEKIREYIKSSNLDVEGLYGDANIVDKKSPQSAILSELAIEQGYIIFIQQYGDNLNCYVNLFNQFEGNLIVSNNASKYKDFKEIFYGYNVVDKSTEKLSFVEKINDVFKEEN